MHSLRQRSQTLRAQSFSSPLAPAAGKLHVSGVDPAASPSGTRKTKEPKEQKEPKRPPHVLACMDIQEAADSTLRHLMNRLNHFPLPHGAACAVLT